MSAHQYGPHRSEDAPTHCRTQNGDGAPLHPALLAQRARLNAIAAGTPLAAVNAAAPVDEWQVFVAAVREVAVDGLVHANDVRPLIRGRIFHKRIGRFYKQATDEGLLVRLHNEDSADVEGRNTHHGSGVFRLGAAA